jgi:hypothetical protein
MKEGVKVKIGTWVGKQKQKKQSSFVKGVKLTAKKTIKWAKRKRKRRNGPQSDTAQHDVVALDAGMKYKELAKRRLDAARASFEAAAIELKAAENGMQDAERYVKSLRAHCEHVGNQNAVIDVVFVEHQDQKEVDRLDNNVLFVRLIIPSEIIKRSPDSRHISDHTSIIASTLSIIPSRLN